MSTRKELSQEQLEKRLVESAEALLVLNGHYSAASGYTVNFEDDQVEALTVIVAKFSDLDASLEKLGKKVRNDLKDKDNLNDDDRDGILKKRSVLALWRYIENCYDEAPALFSAVENRDDARCSIDSFLKEIMEDLPSDAE